MFASKRKLSLMETEQLNVIQESFNDMSHENIFQHGLETN